jgi:spore coat protein CotH
MLLMRVQSVAGGRRFRLFIGVAGLSSLAALACSDAASPASRPAGEGARAPATLDALYAPEHRLEVRVELAPADWQSLRAEGRSLFDGFLGESEEFAYTELVGSVSVDGERFENVSVRKKGFLGSLSRPRPSLKLDFGEVEDAPPDGSAPRAFERLTLNNNRQDYSRSRTCMAYRLFERAGLPAPRCNLAHVVVNGEDLGTYANVEPIRKPLLARHFGDASGKLYEGQIVDFSADEIGALEAKNEAAEDRAEVDRLVAALGAGDDELVARLSEVLDLDRFRDFWAMETLSGHWDGYSGNRNNYYLYVDPASGLLQFIPWGTDGAFAEAIPGDARNTSAVVYARALLARRLYALPAERARFRERLAELVDQAWDPGVLIDELDGLSALAPDTLPEAVDTLRDHLAQHPERVRTQLAAPAPDWIDNAAETSPCFGTIGDFDIEFVTDYGDLAALDPAFGSFEVGLAMDGRQLPTGFWFGRAGPDPAAEAPTIAVRALTFFEDGRGVFLQLNVPPSEFSPGDRPFHGFESGGLVVALDGDASRFVGFISEGTIELTAAGTEPGAPVRGRAHGQLLQTGCADL